MEDDQPIGSFFNSRSEQSSSNSNTQCVVCSASLGMELWNNKNAKVCLKCKADGKTNHRWCIECNRLRIHQGRGLCRECYYPSYMASKKSVTNVMTSNADSPPTQVQVSQVSDNSQKVVEQIVKICHQYSTMANDLNKNSEDSEATKQIEQVQQSNQQGTSRRKQQKPAKISEISEIPETQEQPEMSKTQEQPETQEDSNTACVVCSVPLTTENTRQKREKSCLDCRSKGMANYRRCVDCQKIKLCTGRQRCYTCYTIFMCKLRGKEMIGPMPSSRKAVENRPKIENHRNNQSSLNNKQNSSNPFQNLQVDNPQALIEQLVQLLANASNNNDQSKQNGTNPQCRSNEQSSEAIQKTQIQQQSIPSMSRSTNERVTNCLVCQTSLMYENKNQKVCNKCKAEKKQRHRWCVDCNELKQCVGRNRCSFCYTVFMKDLKTSNGIDSSRAKNVPLNQTWPVDQPSTSHQNGGFQLDQVASTSRHLPGVLRQPLISRGIIQNAEGVEYVTVSSGSEDSGCDN